MRLLATILLVLTPAALLRGETEIDFGRDIRPIFTNHCTACHGGVMQKGGVSFVYREQVLGKGDSGNFVVVPGDPDGSELLRRITTDDPDDHMPPADHGRALNDEEVGLLRNWIAQGAEWSDHWSFEAPETHPEPKTGNPDWHKTLVDPFILARLEAEGLKPAPAADPATLLRRVSIDLTGLPPTLDELDAFAKAHAEDPDAALEAEVDRLLASPHFGERWASTWLDLARYADSEGLGMDGRRTAWPYRDWVVRAFNTDLPYDQFLIKQLAGDLLPDPTMDDLVASNFHRLTQANSEGGTDNEEFRVMAVMDRTNTTWEALQGITFGCVQCHDHPYDPIRHEEYYEYLAFFNNDRDLDRYSHYPTVLVPKAVEDYPQAAALEKKANRLKDTLFAQEQSLVASADWLKVDRMEVESTKVPSKTRKNDGYLEFLTDGTIPRGVVFSLDIPAPSGLEELTALRVHTLPLDIEEARHSGLLGAVLSKIILKATLPGSNKPVDVSLRHVIGDDNRPETDPNESINMKSGQGWGADTHQYHPRSCVVIPEQPLALPAGTVLHLELHHNVMAPTGPLTTKRGRIDLTGSPVFQPWLDDEATIRDQQVLKETRAAIGKLDAVALPVMDALPPSLHRTTHLFARGNWLEKEGPALDPATPDSLPPLATDNPDRLALARWIASPENPFTARVLANKAWEQLFGFGLVETTEDFGSAGALPSHPELLDTLAVRFQTTHRWSFKTLLRDLVLSNTYRQSAVAHGEAREVDPRNRLLSRGPRNRFRAETVRDHHLAVSGLLTPDLGGPPVTPPIPDGVWKPFTGGDKWNVPEEGDPQRYRRSLYIYWKRSINYPSFSAFDAPTRENCSTRRLSSNTPLAALTTLNDEAFAEMAKGLARRMKYDTEGETTDKLATGYRLATSHRPTEAQLTEVTRLFRQIEQHYTENPDLYEGLAGTPDGAAYTVVASSLLNLDAALTK